jgi:DNA excision repair protein ERCC-3
MSESSVEPQNLLFDIAKTQHELEDKINQFKKETAVLEQQYESALLELQRKGYKIDNTQIPVFMKRFWHTYPTKNPNEWEVAIPVFIPFNIGWFDRAEGGYNIFTINRYTKWFGEKIPEFISHEINLPSALDLALDGLNLTFPEGKQEQVENKFGKHLNLIEKDKATVKQGHEFDLIAEIIDSGSLPFVPKAIVKEDLMLSDFTQIWDELDEHYNSLQIFEGKYSYQGQAWDIFEKYGSVGIFWAMSFGKTVIGTYIYSRIKGLKALVVPSLTLKEQWTQFFKWNCPRLLNEVEIYTYQGMSRKTWDELKKKNYVVLGFDECHVLPADSFSKLATIKAKYRFGLSATPYREDNRTNYIMALTGYPIGLDWRTIMHILGKEYHTVNVHVVKDLESKYALAKQLYNPERRTIIFVNLLGIGEKLSDMLGIPFIRGETKNRLDIIKENKSFVASRVLELGVSIKDLEHIIEVDFLFGSRREEMQRTGRLMHSLAKDKIHDVIMTKDELESYGKRLFSLYEKGFRPRMIPHLAGVQAPIGNGDGPKKKVSHIGSKDWRKIVQEMQEEGFFHLKSRTNTDVTKELTRRGIIINQNIQANMSNILNGMVKKKQLFKVPTEKGMTYTNRNT